MLFHCWDTDVFLDNNFQNLKITTGFQVALYVILHLKTEKNFIKIARSLENPEFF